MLEGGQAFVSLVGWNALIKLLCDAGSRFVVKGGD